MLVWGAVGWCWLGLHSGAGGLMVWAGGRLGGDR